MEIIRSAFDGWKRNPSRAALIRLLESSQVLIFGVCFEVLRHRHDAEDATQRVLLEIQKDLDRVADAEHFLRRVRLTAFRTALDNRRDRRRRADRERKAANMNPTPPLPDDVREAIHEAMSSLDEESRALVIEHYFEKETLDVMAARRGVSSAAIWKRIQGIKHRLREGLVLAGLAAAASKAEACLEAAALVAPPANLVTVATIGGGLMAAKTSVAAAATIVATLTFALGLGSGLAIQAARDAGAPQELPVVRNGPSPHPDRVKVTKKSATPSTTDTPVVPVAPPVETAEDRLKLAREIWEQMSRRRFWKDQEAKDETLPKLKRLGPEQAPFFIDKFRDPEVEHEQKKDAIRLAVTCGGPDAAALILELIHAPPSKEVSDYRLLAKIVLDDEFDRPDLPVKGALWDSAMALRSTAQGWDLALAWNLLTYGDRKVWMPILMEGARSAIESLLRSEAVELLARNGGADALKFLQENRETISTMAPDPRYGAGAAQEVERQKYRLGRVVDMAIEKLEQRFKK